MLIAHYQNLNTKLNLIIGSTCYNFFYFYRTQYRINMDKQQEVYFERQTRFSLLCGMHSVNNILGGPFYNKEGFNQICYSMSEEFINPHKHLFGGDFDVNVLIVALQKQKCKTKWYDRRSKQFKINEEYQGRKLVGYLINQFVGSVFFSTIFRVSPRHWIAVRKVKQRYYFLDSKQDYQHFQKPDAEKKINQILWQFQNDRKAEVIEVYQKSSSDKEEQC